MKFHIRRSIYREEIKECLNTNKAWNVIYLLFGDSKRGEVHYCTSMNHVELEIAGAKEISGGEEPAECFTVSLILILVCIMIYIWEAMCFSDFSLSLSRLFLHVRNTSTIINSWHRFILMWYPFIKLCHLYDKDQREGWILAIEAFLLRDSTP